MAGSGARVKVPADRLDVLPSFSRAGDACCRRSDGTLVEERRRRCEPVEGSEEVEGSSVVKEREEKRTQKRSEKSRQTRRNDRLGRDEPLRRNAQLLRFRVALLTRNSGRLCAGIERDVARPGRGQGPDGRGERRRKTLAGRTGGSIARGQGLDAARGRESSRTMDEGASGQRWATRRRYGDGAGADGGRRARGRGGRGRHGRPWSGPLCRKRRDLRWRTRHRKTPDSAKALLHRPSIPILLTSTTVRVSTTRWWSRSTVLGRRYATQRGNCVKLNRVISPHVPYPHMLVSTIQEKSPAIISFPKMDQIPFSHQSSFKIHERRCQ